MKINKTKLTSKHLEHEKISSKRIKYEESDTFELFVIEDILVFQVKRNHKLTNTYDL